ncbi:hypothetical protein BDV93DRAFT_557485 [Ceratobasidium sp. AG-I]|nr:hypothetical protein BDV93DRAFT_557485 [Ceratobasidium sp. AG-I]
MEDTDTRVFRAARSLMDFMYMAHVSSVTDEDINAMDDALRTFHAHKDIFEPLGALVTDQGFHGIPKIHLISHYMHLIQQLGTPDGYNTKTSKRLHIDFAKLGYQVSNRVNTTKQMVLYIQRMEAIMMHAAHLSQSGARVPRLDTSAAPLNQEQEPDVEDKDKDYEDEEDKWDGWFYNTVYYSDDEGGSEDVERQVYHLNPEHVVAKTPTVSGVLVDYIISTHGATRFVPALHAFLRTLDPNYDYAPFTERHRFNLWTRARLFHSPPPFNRSEGPWTDVIRAQPEKSDQYSQVSQRARFDTVLIESRKDKIGAPRYCPARVRTVFELPVRLSQCFPYPHAYVELFNYVGQYPIEPSGLFTITHNMSDQGYCACAVVPLSSIHIMTGR